jgi:hypothetical protein
MGTIWLETTNGKLIHIPVVGDDVNTPNDLPRIPTSVLNTTAYKLSGDVEINVKGCGMVTFDFGVPGRIGQCNRCGQCCTHPIAQCKDSSGTCGYVVDTKYHVHKCQHLIIDGRENSLGTVGRTLCRLRPNILNRYKGCTLAPEQRESWMVSCSFTFVGE